MDEPMERRKGEGDPKQQRKRDPNVGGRKEESSKRSSTGGQALTVTGDLEHRKGLLIFGD